MLKYLFGVEFTDVFTNHIKFNIDNTSNFERVKVGVFVGIGNNGYRKTMGFGIDHR